MNVTLQSPMSLFSEVIMVYYIQMVIDDCMYSEIISVFDVCR